MSTEVQALRHKKLVAEVLMMFCGAFAFGWIPPALVLIWRDTDLRPVLHFLWQLWPLAPIPVCALGAAWWWRVTLQRRLRELSVKETGNNG
jgi:hypothetical protein